MQCWVLRDPLKAPGAGAGGEAQDGEDGELSPPYTSHPVLGLALLQGRGSTDSISALRLLI